MLPKEVIAELAETFDRYNNAMDPTSEDAGRAEDEFHAKAYALHAIHAPKIEFRTFRYEMIAQCRRYLAKN